LTETSIFFDKLRSELFIDIIPKRFL